VTAATLYTHFTTFFVLLFEGVVLLTALVRSRRREALWVIALLALLAVPLTLYALSRAQHGVDPVFGFRPLDSMVAEVWGTFIVGRGNELFQPWWVVLPGVLMFALGLSAACSAKRAASRPADVSSFVPLAFTRSSTAPHSPAPSHAIVSALFGHGLGLALVWSCCGRRNAALTVC
jgi:hypothetical protein